MHVLDKVGPNIATRECWSEAVKRLKPRLLQRIIDTFKMDQVHLCFFTWKTCCLSFASCTLHVPPTFRLGRVQQIYSRCLSQLQYSRFSKLMSDCPLLSHPQALIFVRTNFDADNLEAYMHALSGGSGRPGGFRCTLQLAACACWTIVLCEHFCHVTDIKQMYYIKQMCHCIACRPSMVLESVGKRLSMLPPFLSRPCTMVVYVPCATSNCTAALAAPPSPQLQTRKHHTRCTCARGCVRRGKAESGKEGAYSCVVLGGARSMEERRRALAAFKVRACACGSLVDSCISLG